jgi:hypothetical protein
MHFKHSFIIASVTSTINIYLIFSNVTCTLTFISLLLASYAPFTFILLLLASYAQLTFNVTRTPEHTHWLVYFFLGLSYCDSRERDNDRNIISFIGYFFLGFHIVTTGNVFLFLPITQKRKSIKTLGNLIYTRFF